MTKQELQKVYKHSSMNVEEIRKSKLCGCFYCKKIFHANEVEDFIDGGQTALCPYCDIDSVIGDASDISIKLELLDEMNKKYFD